MKLRHIALKNILRRKAKSGFVLAGLVVGVATVVGIITYVEAMTADINHKLEKYGANILVVPHTDQLSLSYGGLSLGGVSFDMRELSEASVARIHEIKNNRNLAAVGPVALGAVEIGGQRVLLAGVDFKVAPVLKPWWQVDGRLPGVGEVMLGHDAARILQLSVGDPVEVAGRPLAVSGVLAATGSQDDQILFTTLGQAQTVLGKEGQVSMVEVAALCEACPIEEMTRQISGVLPGARVMGIQQVVKGRMETLHQFQRFSYGISAVMLFIGGLVVLVTLMGNVRERTEEIGIFRAIGFRQRHVMAVVFMEAGLVSAVAGVLGFVLGVGGAWLGLWLRGAGHRPAVGMAPELFCGAVLIAVVVGLCASAYPARMAARMDPNQALRAL
ncbi:MAG: FtsX-like permease family protein [Desulfosarcinaceae bacterium]|nr:FtsX-like permease family protein [Desulfosarcinaceae bacterium]